MSTLELWVRTPLAQTLGWTLFHFLWEGALIALGLAAALYFARPSARLRYAFACLAMFLMPVTATVTFTLCTPSPVPGLPVMPRTAALPHAAVSPVGPAIPPFAPERKWERLAWLAPFWFAGVILFYLYSLASWVAARKLRRVGICPATKAWQARLNALSRRLGLTRPVSLLESCLTDVPIVIGLVKPIILMPVGLLTGLSVDQLECILIHELAHVRRHDYLVNLLQSFVEGLLFYHPAVWWVSGLVRCERENCCDDVVVEIRGDARGYAIALATLERNRWRVQETALAVTGGSLMNRIHRLLKQPEGPRFALTPVFSAVVVLATVGAALAAWETKPAAVKAPKLAVEETLIPAPTAVPVVWPAKPAVKLQAQVQAAPPAAQDSTTSEPLRPYRKWLNEDVAYIITDAERAVYKQLQADEEREKFIEQFWLRRDPTPDTAENEFKAEHYRRIAYANEHFASKIPGWKTDRGRIYITYGPPDEIEDHSSGGTYQRPAEQGGGVTSVFPFQQWRYRYIEGIGDNVIIEFVDPAMTGEFRMTMDPAEKESLRVAGALSEKTARPASSAATRASAAVPNLFTSGGPGPGLTVEVTPDRQVVVNVGVSQGAPPQPGGNASLRPSQITGQIQTDTGRVIDSFRDANIVTCSGLGAQFTCPPAPAYRRTMRAPAGSYTLKIEVTNGAGEVSANQVKFFVN